jgi:hypothetical protein
VLTLKKRRGEEQNRREEKKIEARGRESVLGFGEGGGRERRECAYCAWRQGGRGVS